MIDYRNVIKNRELRIRLINLLRFIPDEPYIKMVYYVKTGKKLNLDNPKGFNEKLNWLKIHDIHPEYTELVDKYAVRSVVKSELGDDHIFPLLGIWPDFSSIDFNNLPKQFVLKCTHDSGSIRVIRDKGDIDYYQLKKFFDNRLKLNPYYLSREYPYKNVKPKIIAEELMLDTNGNLPTDYKFFCFDGQPKLVLVAKDREKEATISFYDMDFNPLNLYHTHKRGNACDEKPVMFNEMKKIAKKLSQGMKFVRLDFYELNDNVYFGEYTFFPGGGFYLFYPEEWEQRLGDLIIL